MKRVALVILIIVLILLAYFFKSEKKINHNDYEKWEKECMNEYNVSSEHYIFVDIPTHKMYLFKGDELIKTYLVSTGTYDTPSPVGIWKIVSKSDWGEGFGGRWMGFNVPWGKYGIHGTLQPGTIGWGSSQGCIRMFNKDVKELYSIVKHGTRVEIYSGPRGAFESGLRTLVPGDRGADVYEVQVRLKNLGYFSGYIDGIFGPSMESAVLRFQKEKKLYQDKKIGKKMYELLGIINFE